MPLLKKVAVSLSLFIIASVLGLSIFFYHVSAVQVYANDQKQHFISTVEGLHNLSECEWISELIIKQKVITLKCLSPVFGDRYLHFDEKWSILGEVNPKSLDFDKAKAAFTNMTNLTDFSISLTVIDIESVYWISKDNEEWLLDLSDYSIIWKVNKNYD